MKAQPYKLVDGHSQRCEVSEATHVQIRMPGPQQLVTLPIILKGTREGTGCWTWNGDTEKPTLHPSILSTAGHFVEGFDPAKDSCWCKYSQEHPDEKPHFHCWRCHTHVNDGKAAFLADTSHELAGQSVDLLDVP